MSKINPKLVHVSKHRRDASIAARLDNNLRQQYKLRSYRVIKGDTVRVMRGEYSGIEGIQREKVRGGNVKVKIHSSNVTISNLNLDDKYRQNALQGRTSKDSSRPIMSPIKNRSKKPTKKERGKKPTKKE